MRAGNIPAGTVQVELRNTKLGISKSIRLTVPAGGTVKRKITVAKGTVRINVRPWAVVYLRGRKLGTTPMPPLSLYEGRHSLRLVNPDSGKERTVKVDVRAGKVTRVIETLD